MFCLSSTSPKWGKIKVQPQSYFSLKTGQTPVCARFSGQTSVWPDSFISLNRAQGSVWNLTHGSSSNGEMEGVGWRDSDLVPKPVTTLWFQSLCIKMMRICCWPDVELSHHKGSEKFKCLISQAPQVLNFCWGNLPLQQLL